MRCPECGFSNSLDAPRCARCGEALRSDEEGGRVGEVLPQETLLPQNDSGAVRLMAAQRMQSTQNSPARVREGSSSTASRRGVLSSVPVLTGTVISTEPVYYEDPDFDPARFLNRLLLVIEFLGLPVFLLWYFMTYYGPLSFIIAILALIFFFRLFSPLHLLAMLGIFQHFNPFRTARERTEQEPVQYFRVRASSSNREVIVRRKGHLRDGNVMTGDEISIWGDFRGGTLHFRNGISLRTGARISLRRNYSWVFLLVNLAVAGFLVGLFYEPFHAVMSHLVK